MVVLLVAVKRLQLSEMMQRHVANTTNRLRSTRKQHLLKVAEECFIRWYQLIYVSKEDLRFICWNDGRILASGVGSQWICVQLLEQSQSLDVVPFCCDELVNKVC